mmetsp:Transcript_136352/g.291190  ORF Transcript_136352/g.291190 Transcript_136352/m.291190 type:complete len:222 (+) Transcript_136352:283-948(+)
MQRHMGRWLIGLWPILAHLAHVGHEEDHEVRSRWCGRFLVQVVVRHRLDPHLPNHLVAIRLNTSLIVLSLIRIHLVAHKEDRGFGGEVQHAHHVEYSQLRQGRLHCICAIQHPDARWWLPGAAPPDWIASHRQHGLHESNCEPPTRPPSFTWRSVGVLSYARLKPLHPLRREQTCLLAALYFLRPLCLSLCRLPWSPLICLCLCHGGPLLSLRICHGGRRS